VDITAVRKALADAASGVILPAKTGSLTTTWYLPDAVTEPHFFIAEYDQDFDKVFGRGQDEITFTCRLLVGRADESSAQEVLDLMLSGAGNASLKEVLERARGAPGQMALGGLADDFHVTRTQGNRWYEHNGTQYVGAEIIVRVIGSGGI
jgi:hypothetical protein